MNASAETSGCALAYVSSSKITQPLSFPNSRVTLAQNHTPAASVVACAPRCRGASTRAPLASRFTRNMPQTLLKSGEQRRNMIQEFCTRQCIAPGEIRITSDGALPGAEQRVAAVPHVVGQVGQFLKNIRHVYSSQRQGIFNSRLAACHRECSAFILRHKWFPILFVFLSCPVGHDWGTGKSGRSYYDMNQWLMTEMG